ncbi:MAG: DUF1015 domain-containing protein [Oscillospiraceae bacterium]|nr:DUF1015 domain-containing protein [Oscillospiraceae bacterium]
MAKIRPFIGTRYSEKAGELDELCCPPYDIISEEGRKRLLATNPYNIIRLELPRSYKDGAENDDMASYEEAGEIVAEWVIDGVLKDDEKESIYVYEFSFDDDGTERAVKGFIALVELTDFSQGIVLPHEETLSKAKTDRFNLMKATGCNFSQVYSLYSDPTSAIQDLLETATMYAPTVQFTDGDNVTHKLWPVADEHYIERIEELMEGKQVFIADGHHRYETALKYCKENEGRGSSWGVPMMLVSMNNPGLVVYPTHRLVRDLPNFDNNEILAKSMQYFSISRGLPRDEAFTLLGREYMRGDHAFLLYGGGNKYTLMTLKDRNIMKQIMPRDHESLRGLDVSVLHSLVLERLFGIDKANMAAQTNLTYVKVADEAIAAVDNGDANCCFLLNPTRVSEISDVALSGGKMPQKSTYFYPKLTTGLVINRIFK